MAFVFFVTLGVPIFGAVIGSFVQNLGIFSTTGIHWTLEYYSQVFHPNISGKALGAPLLLSNQLGFVVATGTGVLAVILARRLIASPGSWSQRITDIFLLGSVAIPGVVLGVGYIFFYNLPFITQQLRQYL